MTASKTRGSAHTFFLGSLCGVAAFTALVASSVTDRGPAPGEQAGALAALEPPAARAEHPAAASVGTQYSDVAEAVLPAVVWIDTTTIMQVPDGSFSGDDLMRRFFGDNGRGQSKPREFSQRGLGSGVIISPDGTIVTNHHVAGEADELQVTLNDGRKFEAKLVGTDPATDLAVIRLVGDVDGLPTVPLGNSDSLRLGEVVMAIGNPFGLSGSVSLGIVSAKERSGMGINRYENYIQTDAAINRGNSGGALVNMRGQLVGINDAIYSPGNGMMGFGGGGNVGIGFAIPTNQAGPIIDSLIAKGTVDRGWLGVHIQDLTAEMTAGFAVGRDTKGVIIARVAEGSPAEKAGVKDGDIVVSVDGTKTEDTEDLRNLIAMAGPGHAARVEVLRNGKGKRLTVRLGAMPDQDKARVAVAEKEPEEESVQVDGLHLGELEQFRRRFRVDEGIRDGVVVTAVEPGSSAAEAELKAGDIIVEVNRAGVNSVKDFQRAVNSTDGPPLLLVRRGAATIYMVLEG
jgi:serine protease Do